MTTSVAAALTCKVAAITSLTYSTSWSILRLGRSAVFTACKESILQARAAAYDWTLGEQHENVLLGIRFMLLSWLL